MLEEKENILLDVKDLSVALESTGDTATCILDNINIQIKRKQRVALIGQSGSGKTITSRAILGLLSGNMKISSGQINFNNKLISLNNDSVLQDLRGKKISMVFQEPHAALNPVFRIGTQLTDIIMTNLKISKKSAKEKALDSLSQVGFSNSREIFKIYPGQLSGGMAQRVLIAMAISCQPELIIADEPTSALDSVTQSKILKLIFELQEKFQFAVLIISHDIPLVKKYVDYVYILKDGIMVYSGAVKDIAYPNPDPYIQSLFDTLPNAL